LLSSIIITLSFDDEEEGGGGRREDDRITGVFDGDTATEDCEELELDSIINRSLESITLIQKQKQKCKCESKC
jgi:hypothetical protein